MKIQQLPILLIFVCCALPAAGQLTASQLEAAVQGQSCDKVAAALEKTPLHSEAMKFNAAICRYRNGEAERALALFQEVQQMEAQKQHLATFWVAKCHAKAGQDSLAVAALTSMPTGTLHHRMLSLSEFERLAKENEAFTRLQQSLAPSFNLWTGLLTVVTVLGLLIGGLLCFGRSRFSAGERWLALTMFSFGLILGGYVLIWTGYVQHFPYLQDTWQFLTLLVGPSLFFYLKDTFKEDYSAKELRLHFLLPAVCGLLSLPALLGNFGIKAGLPGDLFNIASAPVLLTGHLLFYATLIHAMTRNEWQVDANIRTWTRIVSGGMMAYSLAFLAYFMLVNCSFFNPEWDYAISLVMALGILSVAYMGLLQRRVFNSEPIGQYLPTTQKYRSSTLTESASLSIKRQMERLLTEQQVFKENELRLADLAAYLDISYHALSQVINEHYGVNFFELVNRYRVEHVKRLLADPAYGHYTIMQIAYEAGFNNKASFNRFFKKEIGMTPSAFRIKEGVIA